MRLREGEVRLFPGRPVNLPERQGRKLIERAKGHVAVLTGLTGQSTIDVKEGCVVYWHSATERKGPGTVVWIDSKKRMHWVLVQYGGSAQWVHGALIVTIPQSDRR